jgi:phosphatidylglycerophosphatase A
MIPEVNATVTRSGPLTFAAQVLATGFGSGYSPVAPGTAGSVVGLLLFWWPLGGWALWAQGGAALAVFAAGVAASSHVARRAGIEDPGIVVVDEIVGMWVTLLALPFTPATAAAGFFLFRVMDVVKPWPARSFERFPGGLGIMADDLMAGVYANLVLRAALWLWPR